MAPPSETVERRALKNTLAGGAAFILSSLTNFVTVPICLREWGAERYGVWLALYAGFMMLRTLDTGYVTYVSNQVNVLYHQDREQMRRSLASSLWVSLGIGLTEILVFVGIVLAGKLRSLVGLEPTDIENYGLVSALGILIVIGGLTGPCLAVIHRLLIPAGMMFQASWWSTGYLVVQGVALAGAAMLHSSIIHAALLSAVLQACFTIAFAIYVRRRAPQFIPWWRGGEVKTGLRDFARSQLLTINFVGLQATTSGVVVLVSAMLGADSVPSLTTIRTLSNLWVGIATQLAVPLFPEVVRYHGSGEHEKLFAAFRAHWFFSGLIVNGSMIVALPLVESFYVIWTRGTLPFERGFFVCALASISLSNFASMLAIYLSGINSLVAQLVTTAVRALVIFGVAAALLPSMGVRGVGIAMIAAELICSVGLGIYFTDREMARFGTRLPRASVGFALLGTVPLQFLAIQMTIDGKIHLIACVLAAVALTIIGWLGWQRLDPSIRVRARQSLRLAPRRPT